MRWSGKSLGARDRYSVTRRLGAGCLGETLEARDTTSGDTVVIKLLDAAHARDRECGARLETEVAQQSALRNPALSPLFVWLGDGDVIGAVRRFATGQDLDAWIQGAQTVTAETTRGLLEGVLAGLAAAHQASLAHLGIAPTNILVEGPPDAPRVTLVDLGLARVLGSQVYLSVYPGSPLLAPEQTAAPHLSDARSDIFTLGVLFRAFADGRRLTRAGAGSLGRRLPLSPELDAVLQRAVAADPSRRFVDASAMQAALRPSPGTARSNPAHRDEAADTVREPAPSRARSAPPPLPAAVSGEHDTPRRPRTTQQNAAVRAQSTSNPSLPAPSGWFSNISPTRPTWETTPVSKTGEHSRPAPAAPTLPANARPSSQTVRLAVPLAGDTDASAQPGPLPVTDGRESTLRLRSPFASEERLELPEPPSSQRARGPALATGGSTTVIRVPRATEDDASPSSPDTPAPLPSGRHTTRLQIPLPADPGELALEPPPAREASEEAPPERVDKTMVIPVGRPAAVPAGPPEQGAPSSEVPPSPFRRGGAPPEAEQPARHSFRAPTGDLEAAAEAGAAGALGTFDMPSVEQKTLSQRYGRVGPPSRTRFLLLGLLLGLLIGGAGGLFIGYRLLASPSAANPDGGDDGPSSVEIAPPEGARPETTQPVVTLPGDESGTSTAPTADPVIPLTESPPLGDASSAEVTAPPEPTPELVWALEGTGTALDATVPPGLETPPALAETAPAPLAGPLVFSSDLWQPGNYWVFRYRRTTPADAAEFQDLEYYTRRSVESVVEHPFGYRVTLVDEGGVTQPARQEILASASCLLDLRNNEARFCLPPTPSGLVPTPVVGAPPGVVELAERDLTVTFSPWAGWVHESRIDRQGRAHEAELVGYHLGARAEGLATQPVLTCDWRAQDDRGTRAGRAGRDDTPDMTALAAWGLNGNVRRFDLPLLGEPDSTWLRAWSDGERTAYQVLPSPTSDDAPLVDPAAPVTLVELPLDDAKVWSTPDGLTDKVTLVFDDEDGTQMVRLLTVGAGGLDETDLLPASHERGARLTVVLLANLDSCYVQIRRGRWQAMHYADYRLDEMGATRLGGDLESSAPAE